MKYDFKDIAARVLQSAEVLLKQWLPAGIKVGHEYQCGNLNGDKGNSLSINIKTGVWADFASGERGGDLLSLYAAIKCNNDQYKAVQELAESFGIKPNEQPSFVTTNKPTVTKSKSPWLPVLPVPDIAGTIPVAHIKRGMYQRIWTYKNKKGQVLGYICRFETSDGGKEILPLVYAKDTSANGDKYDWRWLSFPEPRPLYNQHNFDPALPILIVEGEKCADVAQAELGSKYFPTTWTGGSNAVNKSDWSWVCDCDVVLWPDCDSQIEKRTGQYYPANKQPGLKAMLQIAEILIDQGCRVQLVKIDEPGVRSDGYDIADYVSSGLTGDALHQYIQENLYDYVVVQAKSESEKPAQGKVKPPNKIKKKNDDWTDLLIRDERWRVDDCRENVVLCLENHPNLKGAIKYNEFTARIVKVKPLPWTAKLTEWTDTDDLELSNFLAFNSPAHFKSMANIGLGVQLVASRNRYHPLKEWLYSIKWDGQDRLGHWLPAFLGVDDTPYSALVGRLWLRQAVNRIINPGCKADYVLILEGEQGLKKSSALRVLGGDYFSDAPLDLNSKDVYQAINGVHIYEIAELDAFNRSESTRIKAFITQPIDRYRVPYEKRMIEQPRHVVFAGTTNNYEYHKDMTGNRRFWSVRCRDIDLEVLAKNRDQLFAQAKAELEEGGRCYPTREQERDLIAPEQEMREVVDAWYQAIANWLDQPEQRLTLKDVTTIEILHKAIFMDTSKITSTKQSETKVGVIMHKLGWIKKRRGSGTKRQYYYARSEA